MNKKIVKIKPDSLHCIQCTFKTKVSIETPFEVLLEVVNAITYRGVESGYVIAPLNNPNAAAPDEISYPYVWDKARFVRIPNE